MDLNISSELQEVLDKMSLQQTEDVTQDVDIEDGEDILELIRNHMVLEE